MALILAGCASGDYSARRSIDDSGTADRSAPGANASSATSDPEAADGGDTSGDTNETTDGNGSRTATDPATSDGDTAGDGSRPTKLTAELEAEIRRLARFLASDPDGASADAANAARFAEKRLLEIGPVAVPVLEDATTADNAIDVAAVIVRIRQQAAKDGVPVPAGPAHAGEPADDGSSSAAPPPHHPADTADPTPETGPDAATDAATDAGTADDSASADDNGPRISELDEREFIERLVGDSPMASPVDEAAIGRFVWRKLREMEDLAARLDYDGAIRIGEAILTLLPGSRFARQIRGRLDEFRSRKLQMQLLDGRIVALPPEVRYGDTITFRLTLRNVSDKQLTISFTSIEYRSRMQQDVYNSPAVLRVKFTQYVDPSTPISNTRNEYLQAEGDVSLDPGQVWSMDWVLDTRSAGAQVRAIGEYEVSGQIRPLSVNSIDGIEQIRMIRCEPATARVLPAGYESARENPLQSLQAAFRAPDPVAAVLAAGAAREAARSGGDPMALNRVVAWLLTQLDQPRRTRQLAFQALRAATGLGFGFDERHWRIWHEANRDKPGLGLDRPAGELDDPFAEPDVEGDDTTTDDASDDAGGSDGGDDSDTPDDPAPAEHD